MARLLHACIRDINSILDHVFNGARRWPPHGYLPCLASSGPMDQLTLENESMKSERPPPASNRLSELFGIEWGILWGAPVSKTPRPKKLRRLFMPSRMFAPRTNLVPCQQCGSWHEIHAICGECYKKVREETEVIKRRLLAYDPHKGEFPDKEAVVVYRGEQPPNENTATQIFGIEQKIVEIDKPRPSWFSADLKKRWRNLKPFVYEKPKESH